MNKLARFIIWPVIAAPAAYVVAVWDRLPATVPVHFNFRGEADRFGSKNELVLVIAVLMALATAIYLLLPLAYKIDPKKTAAGNKTRLQRLAFVVAIFLSFIGFVIIRSAERGDFKFDGKLVFVAVGLAIILASLLVSGTTLFIVFVLIMLNIVLIPCIYSYRLYKKH